MNNLQFPKNELGFLCDKITPFIKKRKRLVILLYILFIIYFSLPSFQIPLLQYSLSHVWMPEDYRRRVGIADQLVRLSVGLENIEDLTEDLEQALA